MAEPTAQSMGEDWTRELAGYPDWAIENALGWWISRDNKRRGKKPLPGDISEAAHRAAALLIAAKTQIAMYEKYGDNPPSFVSR